MYIKSMLRNKYSVDVVSISEPLVDGPFGSLIERIIEWMDEFYSIRLSGDVTRGMTQKALNGGYQCRPPLGYRIPYHKATPEIVPDEAKIVRLIFEKYVYENMSIFAIVKHLNSLGHKTSMVNLLKNGQSSISFKIPDMPVISVGIVLSMRQTRLGTLLSGSYGPAIIPLSLKKNYLKRPKNDIIRSISVAMQSPLKSLNIGCLAP